MLFRSVALGGRGTLIGAALGAAIVNYLKTYLTGALPEIWLFALGGLFIAVTLLFPKGVVGEIGNLQRWVLQRARIKLPSSENGNG